MSQKNHVKTEPYRLLDAPQAGFWTCKKIGAMLCVCFSVVCWVSESELLQFIQDGSDSYNQSFFLCWIIVSSYSWFLVPWCLWHRFFKPSDYCPPLDHNRRLVRASFYLTPLFVFCGYFWYASLSQTSVSGNIVVYNSSSMFVYCFSLCLLKERFSLLKILAVLVSIAGVIMVAVPQSSDNSDGVSQTVGGYVLVVLSTVMNALYQVLYQRIVERRHRGPSFEQLPQACSGESSALPPVAAVEGSISLDLGVSDPAAGSHDPSRTPSYQSHPSYPYGLMMDTFLFLGSMGVFTFFLLWPFLIIFHFSRVEPFRAPSHSQISLIAFNSFLDSSMSTFQLIGIVWSSSLFMSVGSVLSLPTSAVADKLIHSYELPGVTYGGIVLVFLGFMGLNCAEYVAQRRQYSWWRVWL